jgi:hypothetical protein
MGKGGSPPPAPTQVSQLTIPEYAQPYMEKLLGRTEALTARQLPVFGGQRTAAPSSAQLEVQQAVRNMPQYAPGQFRTSMFGAPQAQTYMSPYMQNVVDIQKRKAIEDAQKTQLGVNLASARQGTYGGARQLLAQTQREKALSEGLGDIQGKGLQSAYEQAQQQFERDREALRQVQAMRESSRQFAGTYGIQQKELQARMAEQDRLTRQREIDAALTAFQEREAAPYKQLGYMSDILRGTGSLTGGRAIYEAPPSLAQQAVGLGLPALAIARGLG